MYRKGKALGELGYFEKAVQILEQLKKESPNGKLLCKYGFIVHNIDLNRIDAPSAEAELTRLRAIDKARERKANQKLKGWCSFVLIRSFPLLTLFRRFPSEQDVIGSR
jgi:hypothetical protein